jgi:nitrous oxidase accessory protein NosD
MKRKWLAIGIILLLMGTCIIPVIAQDTKKPLPTSDGKWLYVGGSGPGNYSQIKDAIDNASDGDTVFVYQGTYYEYYIQILKKIHLMGEERNTTIIDGQGKFSEVLHIENDVTIQGFTIKNTNTQHYGDVAVFVAGNENDIVISRNIITECAFGIYNFYGSDGHIDIFNNIFLNNTDASIAFNVFSNTINIEYSIHDNYFYSNHIGIKPIGGKSVSIEHNHFEDNDIAIDVLGSHAIINRNNFINNERQAQVTRLWLLPGLFSDPMYYKPSFNDNYWNNWNRTTPRPILGMFLVLFFLGIYSFPLFLFPLVQFDWHPAQTPYNIGG